MKPTDGSNPIQRYGGADSSSSSLVHPVSSIVQPSYLESPPSELTSSVDTTPITDITPVSSLPPTPSITPNDRFSVFHLNHTALLVTALVLSFVVLIGLATLFFGNYSSKSSTTSQGSSSPSSQYAIGNLSLTNLNSTTAELQLGTAEQLTINGRLLVNDTVVLAPGIAPTTPLTGQLYYDKTTNQPYFYNGTQFISLQPTTATTTSTSPQATTPTVTSLGSSTGDITLGTGLSMTANQLDVPTTFIQSQLTNLNATNITTGTLADARLTTNVTVQGNSFNGVSQLVQTTAGGILPILSGANLTTLNGSNISSGTVADARLSANVALLNGTQTFTADNTFSSASNSFTGNGAGLTSLNGSNITTGTVANAQLTTNVTLQGNTFNGVSQLVQTTAGGVLPILSGANLTSLNGSNISSGTVADARLSANATLQGNSFNGASQLVQTNASSQLPVISGALLTFLDGTSITSGTVADARLSANITIQGNTFNGASQLLQLTAGGILPALSGTNITTLNGTNISSGTINDSRLSSNVALLNITTTQTFTGNLGIGSVGPVANFQVSQGTTGIGTVSNTIGGTTVTGIGTEFTNTFNVGDTITIVGQTVAISAIASDTSMTTAAITNANTNVAYTLTGGTRLVVLGNGYVGIGTASPGSALDIKGTLRLSGATSGYVGLTVAATAGGTTYTLPSADGTSGQVLSTNGAGVLSWATPSVFVGAIAINNDQNQPFTTVGTPVAILFGQTELIDTDGFHSTASNTSRMTVPTGKDGKYQMGLNIGLASHNPDLYIWLYKNGTRIALAEGVVDGQIVRQANAYGQGDTFNLSFVITGVATDYFEWFIGVQSAGSGTNTIDRARYSFTYLGA